MFNYKKARDFIKQQQYAEALASLQKDLDSHQYFQETELEASSVVFSLLYAVLMETGSLELTHNNFLDYFRLLHACLLKTPEDKKIEIFNCGETCLPAIISVTSQENLEHKEFLEIVMDVINSWLSHDKRFNEKETILTVQKFFEIIKSKKTDSLTELTDQVDLQSNPLLADLLMYHAFHYDFKSDKNFLERYQQKDPPNIQLSPNGITLLTFRWKGIYGDLAQAAKLINTLRKLQPELSATVIVLNKGSLGEHETGSDAFIRQILKEEGPLFIEDIIETKDGTWKDVLKNRLAEKKENDNNSIIFCPTTVLHHFELDDITQKFADFVVSDYEDISATPATTQTLYTGIRPYALGVFVDQQEKKAEQAAQADETAEGKIIYFQNIADFPSLASLSCNQFPVLQFSSLAIKLHCTKFPEKAAEIRFKETMTAKKEVNSYLVKADYLSPGEDFFSDTDQAVIDYTINLSVQDFYLKEKEGALFFSQYPGNILAHISSYKNMNHVEFIAHLSAARLAWVTGDHTRFERLLSEHDGVTVCESLPHLFNIDSNIWALAKSLNLNALAQLWRLCKSINNQTLNAFVLENFDVLAAEEKVLSAYLRAHCNVENALAQIIRFEPALAAVSKVGMHAAPARNDDDNNPMAAAAPSLDL